MLERPAILIVDDRPANRRLYRAILKDAGAELLTAENPEQALQHCSERSFAMILLDVHLSGDSGFELARRMRERFGAELGPLVFVSAVYVHEEDAFRGYQLGAVDYILSPVVPDILRAKAAVFIHQHQLRSQAQGHATAMELAYRELRTAHAELEHFSWSVSHDLRTPLGQIAGLAELLQAQSASQLDERGRGYLSHIEAAARQMGKLIEDLLGLAQLSRGELVLSPVDLSTLASDVAAELAAAEPSRSVQWVLAPGLRVQGDARLLRTALVNLLGNALKYSAGRTDARVEFGSRREAGDTVFFVRDNGVGFDAEAAGERLFRPFQRFHAQAAFKGTGVGLAIVERAIVKQGGRLWAESAPGQGATFFFTLPPVLRAVERQAA